MNSLIQIYKKFKLTLALILLIPLIWFGVKAGWNQADSDFPNYYVSAQLLQNGNLYEAYQVNLFNRHIQHYDKNAKGLFVMYPPTTALLIYPLTAFDILNAKRIWIILSLCALAGLIFLFTKLLPIDFIDGANLMLICGFLLYNDFMLGQVYLVMLFLLLFGWYSLMKHNWFQCGMAWAWLAAFKFLPLFFIPFLWYKKQNKITLILVVTFILIHLLTLLLAGTTTYKSFIQVFTNNYIQGNVANEKAMSMQYQSFEVFCNLLMQEYKCSNWLASSIKFFWKLIWGLIAVFICFKHFRSKYFLQVTLASVTLLLLLFENGSASYHLLFCVFALITVLLVVQDMQIKMANVLAFSAMGFVPFIVNMLQSTNFICNFSRLGCLSFFASCFFIGMYKQSGIAK